jgi:hypothetical protein
MGSVGDCFYSIEAIPIYGDRSGGGYTVEKFYRNDVTGRAETSKHWYPETKDEAIKLLKEKLDAVVMINDHFIEYDYTETFEKYAKTAEPEESEEEKRRIQSEPEKLVQEQKKDEEKEISKESIKEERIKRMRVEYSEYKEYGKIPGKDRQLADEVETKTGYKLVRYSGHADSSGGGSLTFFNSKNDRIMKVSPWGSGTNSFDIRLIKDDDWTESKEINFHVPLMSNEAIARIAEAANNYDETPKFEFHPYGAWTDFNSRLSVHERERLNNEAVSLLERDEAYFPKQLSDAEKAVLRRYSGFGGISASDERGVL